MRKTLFVLPLTILLFSRVDAQPKITVVGGTKFDLDTLMAGQVAEHKVKLRNAGTSPLEIEKVEPSCGCTGTIVSSRVIRPGDVGEVLITFDSKNFTGKVHKSVSIVSNDPLSKNQKVEFTAFVIQEVSVSETRFVFKDAVVGERKTAKVTLTNNGKNQLDLKGYETNLTGLTLKHPGSVKPGESVELVAEFTPSEVKRTLSNNVILQTSNPNKPEILFYVFGSVKEWKFE
jgi:hypothetical protein